MTILTRDMPEFDARTLILGAPVGSVIEFSISEHSRYRTERRADGQWDSFYNEAPLSEPSGWRTNDLVYYMTHDDFVNQSFTRGLDLIDKLEAYDANPV